MEGYLGHMAINLKELRSKRAPECGKGVALAPSSTRQLVRLWNDRQKEHQAAESASWFGGKFATQAELIAYLEVEGANGTRSRAAIAKDAGMSAQTLANYIKKGKVRPLTATSSLVNGSSELEPSP